MKAGEYQIKAEGVSRSLPIQVTLSSKKIEKIEALSDHLSELEQETLKQMAAKIVTHQSVAVDAVSGATTSSNGIKNAVKNVIVEAGGEITHFSVSESKKNSLSQDTDERFKEPDYSKWLTKPNQIDQTMTTDLVIVGGGIAGLSAAVQAGERNLSTILLEKNGFLGGNGTGVEGMLGAETQMQKKAGIDFSKQDVVVAELKTVQYQADGSFWVDLVNNTAENIAWLQKEGVEFDRVDDYHHTCPLPTFHWFKGGQGAIGYIPPMVKRANALGVKILTSSPATGLIFDQKTQTVKGVYAQVNGKTTQINAQAVIFSSGGFGQNKKLIEKEGWRTENMITIGMPGSVGDAYHMAIAAGAKDTIEDSAPLVTNYIQALPVSNGRDLLAGGPALWVNQDGVRFTDESIVERNAILQSQPLKSVKTAYTVFNKTLFDRYENNLQDLSEKEQAGMQGIDKFDHTNAEVAERVLARGVKENKGNSLFEAETLEALADKVGVPADAFVAQVKRYNDFCHAGIDHEFGKVAKDLVPIEGGPYYIARLDISYGISIGGIGENRRFEVIDDNFNKINGLYAAGIDSAMQYRKIYTINLGGSCCAHCVNSGRHAVINAEEYIKEK